MLRRKVKLRNPLSKLIVVCEGEVTEPIYLHGVRRERRIPKERLVIIEAAGDPITLVSTAIDQKAANTRINKREGIDVVDPVWAIFDCDQHLRLDEAIAKAKRNGIHVGFSNPSFELFLLLHYQELNRSEHRDRVFRMLRKHIPSYDKRYDYEGEGLAALYPKAKERCEHINARSAEIAGVQSPPFCSVFEVVDYLKSY